MIFIHDGRLIELYRSLAESERKRASRPQIVDQWKARHPILAAFASDLETMPAFSQAMEKHPSLFPAWQLEVVSAGETDGRLAESFERLAEILDQRRRFVIGILKHLALPIAAIHLTPIVTCGVYLPSEHPAGFLRCYLQFLFAFYIPAMLLIAAWTSWLKDSPKKNDIPLLKSFAKAEFSFYLAAMVRGGVPFQRALDVAVTESRFKAPKELEMLRAAAKTFSAADKVQTAISTIRQLGVLSEEDLSRLQGAELTGQIDAGIHILAKQAEARWQGFMQLFAAIIPSAVYVLTLVIILLQFVAFLVRNFSILRSAV